MKDESVCFKVIFGDKNSYKFAIIEMIAVQSIFLSLFLILKWITLAPFFILFVSFKEYNIKSHCSCLYCPSKMGIDVTAFGLPILLSLF